MQSFRVDLDDGSYILCSSKNTHLLLETMIAQDRRRNIFNPPYWATVWRNWTRGLNLNERLFGSSVFEMVIKPTDYEFILVEKQNWQVFIACLIELVYFERITGMLAILERDPELENVLVTKLNEWTALAKSARDEMIISARQNKELFTSLNSKISDLEITISTLRESHRDLSSRLSIAEQAYLEKEDEMKNLLLRLKNQESVFLNIVSNFNTVLRRIDLQPKIRFLNSLLNHVKTTASNDIFKMFSGRNDPFLNTAETEEVIKAIEELLAKFKIAHDQRVVILAGSEPKTIEESLAVLEVLTTDTSAIAFLLDKISNSLSRFSGTLRAEFSTTDMKINELNLSLERKEAQKAELSATNLELEEDIRKKDVEVSELQKKLDKSLEKLRQSDTRENELKNDLVREKQNFDALKKEIADHLRELERTKTDLSAINRENGELKLKIQSLEAENLSLKSAQRISDLNYQQQLASKMEELVKAKHDLTTLNTELVTLKASIAQNTQTQMTKNNDLIMLNQEMTNIKNNLENVTKEKKAVVKELEDLRRKKDADDRDHDRDSAALRKELNESTKKIKRLEVDLNTASSNMKASEVRGNKDLSILKSTHEELGRKFTQTVQEKERIEKEFKAKIESFESKSAKNATTISSLEAKNRDLTKANEDYFNKMQKLSEASNIQIIELEKLRKDRVISENAIKEKEKIIDEISKERQSLANAIHKHMGEISSTKEQLTSVNSMIDRKKQELMQVINERDSLKSALTTAEQKIQLVEESNQDLASKIRDTIHQKTEEIEAMGEKFKRDLNEKITLFENTIKNNESKLTALTSEKETLADHLKTLISQHESSLKAVTDELNLLNEKIKQKSFFTENGYFNLNEFKTQMQNFFSDFDYSSFTNEEAILNLLRQKGLSLDQAVGEIEDLRKQMADQKSELNKNLHDMALIQQEKERLAAVVNEQNSTAMERNSYIESQKKEIENLQETLAREKEIHENYKKDLLAEASSKLASNESDLNSAVLILRNQKERIDELEAKLDFSHSVIAEYSKKEKIVKQATDAEREKTATLNASLDIKAKACMSVIQKVHNKTLDLSRSFSGAMSAKGFASILGDLDKSFSMIKEAEAADEDDDEAADKIVVPPIVQELAAVNKSIYDQLPPTTQTNIQTELKTLKTAENIAEAEQSLHTSFQAIKTNEAEISKTEKAIVQVNETIKETITDMVATNNVLMKEVIEIKTARENVEQIVPIMAASEKAISIGVPAALVENLQKDLSKSISAYEYSFYGQTLPNQASVQALKTLSQSGDFTTSLVKLSSFELSRLAKVFSEGLKQISTYTNPPTNVLEPSYQQVNNTQIEEEPSVNSELNQSTNRMSFNRMPMIPMY